MHNVDGDKLRTRFAETQITTTAWRFQQGGYKMNITKCCGQHFKPNGQIIFTKLTLNM